MGKIWTIFGTPTCVWCNRAKEFLTERGEYFDYWNIEQHASMRYFKEEFPHAKTVPQIITPDGVKIGGFDALVDYYK